MNKLSELTYRYMKHNANRTFGVIVGVLLTALMIYSIFTCGYSLYDWKVKDSYEKSMGWDAAFICDGKTAEELRDLSKKAGVEASWVFIEDKYTNIFISGIHEMPVQFRMVEGVLPKNENEIIISMPTSRYSKKKTGDVMLDELFSKEDSTYGKVISGVFRDGFYVDSGLFDIELPESVWDGRVTWNPNSSVYGLFTGNLSEEKEVLVFVSYKDKHDLTKQTETMSSRYPCKYFVVNPAAIDCFAVQNGRDALNYLFIQVLLLVASALIGVAGLFIVRNAFNISVHERQRDYGLLRCIGISRRQIILLILTEALLIALIGGILGMAVGHILLNFLFQILRNILRYSGTMQLHFYGKAVIMTILYVAVITGYAMVSPIEKLHKMNVIESLQRKEEINKNIKPITGKGLEKIFGIEVSYAFKNVMRNRGKFLTTLVTLTMGTAIFVGINSTFKMAIQGYYDLNQNMRFYSGEFVPSSYAETASVLKNLADMEEVEKSYAFGYIYVLLDNGKTAEIICLPENEYKDLLKKADLSMTEKEMPGLLWLNPNMERTDMAILTDDFQERHIPVVGSVSEEKVVNVDSEALDYMGYEYYMKDSYLSLEGFYVLSLPDYDLLLSLLKENLSREEVMQLSDNISINVLLNPEKSTRKFDYYIKNTPVIYMDNGEDEITQLRNLHLMRVICNILVTLLLLIFLIHSVNTLQAQLLERKTELDILSAIGMSKKQRYKMLFAETEIAVAISAVAGSLLGVLIAWRAVRLLLDLPVSLAVSWGSILIDAVLLIAVSALVVLLAEKRK